MKNYFGRLLALAGILMLSSTIAVLAQAVDTTSQDTTATASSYHPPKAAKPSSTSDAWNGFYVGGFVGFGMRRATANTSTVFTSTGYFAATSVPAVNSSGRQTLNSTKFNGGGTVGYNHQAGNWVIGAEADFGSNGGTRSATTTTVYPCCAPTSFTVTQSVKTRWLFTARPRLGYAWGNTMAYVTGGLALTDLNYQALFTDTFATAHENGGINKTVTGWTGGGGFESKINDRWSVKGEYLYAQFPRQTITSTNLTAFTPSIAFPTNTFTHSIFVKEHLVRFGFNYHF